MLLQSLHKNERTTVRDMLQHKREVIHIVGRLLLDINRSGLAGGVRCSPQVWQKVVHMGGDYIEGMCLPQVIKSFRNYRCVVTTFYPTLVFDCMPSHPN
jgi:hypothetical protein